MRPDPSHGVFETLLVRDGRVRALRPHLDRLRWSVAALYGRPLPHDLESRVRDEAAPLIGEHRLRVDLMASGDAGITTAPVPAVRRLPVRLEPLVVAGGLGPHKWRDRRLLDARPQDPVPLLIDSDGAVLEGAWGNVWLLEGTRLITPPADGRILPGVTRALLLELAPSLGLHPRQEPIILDQTRAAGAITFMTSSIRLAVPASLIGSPAPPSATVEQIRAALASVP